VTGLLVAVAPAVHAADSAPRSATESAARAPAEPLAPAEFSGPAGSLAPAEFSGPAEFLAPAEFSGPAGSGSTALPPAESNTQPTTEPTTQSTTQPTTEATTGSPAEATTEATTGSPTVFTDNKAVPPVLPVPTVPPAPPASPAPPAPHPALAPRIVSPPYGVFIGRNSTTVSGVREADQEVQLLSPLPGNDPLCVISPDGTSRWSCTASPLPNGPAITLRVVATGTALGSEITVPVLGPPTVSGGPLGTRASDGRVRGTGFPGASVTAFVGNGVHCESRADGSGAWACTLQGVSNGRAPVTARQQSDLISPSSSNDSPPVSMLFDIGQPAAPTLRSPGNGDRVSPAGAEYSGTGEDGATVTVFAGPYSVCSALVIAGAWSCFGREVQPGSYTVIALQQDAAGNVSHGSVPVTVEFGSVAAPSAAPAPSTAPPPASAPSVTPGPSATAGPTATSSPPPTPGPPPTPSPPATDTPSAAAPVPPPPPSTDSSPPSAAPPGAAPQPVPRDQAPAPRTPGGWNDPTSFAAAIAPLDSNSAFPWQQAALLALGALLLFAVPARLLAGTISRARDGRPLWRPARLSGRNRLREEFETSPNVRLNRGVAAGAALVAASTLVMLSGPVVDTPAYVRLLLAVVIALGIVNAVGTLVPWWWSSRVLRVDASVTFLPRYLLLVAVTALGSRLADLHPALLFGLLGSVAIGTPGVQRGRIAAVRALSLIVLAMLGWLTLTFLPASDGFASTLGAEAVNTVVLVAVGSTVVVLMPLGHSSGRSILAWSPPVWTVLSVISYTMLFRLLAPSWGHAAPLLLVAAVAFTGLSVGTWAWQRFVGPAFS
jgi:hypothetical protein